MTVTDSMPRLVAVVVVSAGTGLVQPVCVKLLLVLDEIAA